MASAVSTSASGQDLPISSTIVAESSCFLSRIRAAARRSTDARSRGATSAQDFCAFTAASSAFAATLRSAR